MEKSMGQDEIDALFASALAGASEVQPETLAAAATDKELFNFSRAGQINGEQMKAISAVNELFARNLTHNLGAWLRTAFQVTLVSSEQMAYSEFLDMVPEPSYVCTARLEPLGAQGMIQMDLSLAPPMIDLLLGGAGKAGVVRQPTDIEDEILLSVMEIVVRELNIAWHSVGLKFSLERREKDSAVSAMMTRQEKTVSVSFEVKIPEATGTLNLCLPAVVLSIILRRLVAERKKPRRQSVEAQERIAELVSEVGFGSMLQFPPMRLSGKELVNLAPGNVLRLPLPRNATAELRVGGLPVFSAQPVCSGDHRAAQVHGFTSEALRTGAS